MSRRPDPRIPEIKRRRADTIAKSERVMTMSRHLTLTRGVLADHPDGVGQYPCGGFLYPANASIATTLTRSRNAWPRSWSHVANAFSLLPSTTSSKRAVPPFFLGVRSTMMVTYLLPNGVCRHTCSSTPISSTPSHWAQHRAAGPSGSQRICHTPPRVPMARCRCTRGRNPNPSRPSNTHPPNVLNSMPSRTISFTFSFTQRMKPHGPYTPKSEEPGKSTIQGRIK